MRVIRQGVRSDLIQHLLAKMGHIGAQRCNPFVVARGPGGVFGNVSSLAGQR